MYNNRSKGSRLFGRDQNNDYSSNRSRRDAGSQGQYDDAQNQGYYGSEYTSTGKYSRSGDWGRDYNHSDEENESPFSLGRNQNKNEDYEDERRVDRGRQARRSLLGRVFDRDSDDEKEPKQSRMYGSRDYSTSGLDSEEDDYGYTEVGSSRYYRDYD